MEDLYSKIPAPAFILNESLLRANLEKLAYVSKQADVQIILALKGYALWKSFPLIRKYLHGATASSLNEVKLCNEYMGTRAHTYAPAYSKSEIKEIAEKSSHITFNSLNQYNAYKDICIKSCTRMGLRVNPGYSDITTDMYNPCSPNSRLGIPAHELQHGIPDQITGLHFHALCENNSYSLERVLHAFEERFGHIIPQLQWINMGGGHLITQQDYNVEHLISILKIFKQKYKAQIILEPGGAVGWQTGVLKSTVLDIVNYGNVPTAILDVSFAAHMPDTLEMPYRPAIWGASKDPVDGYAAYRMGGQTCLAGDFLEAYYFPKELRIGDTIYLEDMMHYTMVKTTMFNGVNHPAIYILKENGMVECAREFVYDDYKKRLS
ncbi:MAG TPA: carboxynorspermidine decarboxylase [Bacteroidales bacterium]|nr:carboxynorspermidine decarboxylase [Bacteroidales bacterium]HRS19838.1 carboxynorspermidine decarboxylase [Bacteroidales bacterium]